MGSRIFADQVPAEDAVPVRRLREAGAILIGKTTTPEFGHKPLTDSPLFGVTRNPWDLSRTAGGSSGGAAASRSIDSASSAAARLMRDSSASDSSPTEPVTCQAYVFSAMVASAAPVEIQA